jgi:hypothetical protein
LTRLEEDNCSKGCCLCAEDDAPLFVLVEIGLEVVDVAEGN